MFLIVITCSGQYIFHNEKDIRLRKVLVHISFLDRLASTRDIGTMTNSIDKLQITYFMKHFGCKCWLSSLDEPVSNNFIIFLIINLFAFITFIVYYHLRNSKKNHFYSPVITCPNKGDWKRVKKTLCKNQHATIQMNHNKKAMKSYQNMPYSKLLCYWL